MVKEVNRIRGGEILSSPVITDEKEILLPVGTVLKSEYMELLLSMSVFYVEIEDCCKFDKISNRILKDSVKENYVNKIEKILENHIYTNKYILQEAKKISKEIQEFAENLDCNIIYDYPSRTPNLYEHTLMVTILSLLIAKKINISKERKYEIALGCILHDLGLRYVTVPYMYMDINKLSASDVFEYKKHTILAYTVLDSESHWFPEISKNMVLSHHEKLDGSGFPLKQREQNIECRIIQLCDTFDCMISGMEGKCYSVNEAMNIIFSEAGKKYDKELIKILFSFIAKYTSGVKVKLSNGKSGIVVRQSNHGDLPVIQYLTEDNRNIVENGFCNLEKTSGIFIENVIE